MLGYFVAIAIALQISVWGTYSEAQTCVQLFLGSELHESKFALSEKNLQALPAAQFHPLEAVESTGNLLKQYLENASLEFLPAGSKFAVNLSHLNQIHVVTEGLSIEQHQKLLKILMMDRAKMILMSVPFLFRNRYFEITVDFFSANKNSVSVIPKLAWDLSIPVVSQVVSGFATKATNRIRTYQPQSNSPAEKIRADLMNQRITQDTLATCGLASAIKILNTRKIKYSERDLLQLIESHGIRKIEDIFGPDPGLSLSDAARLLEVLGRRHGFSVSEVKVTSKDDVMELENRARLASEGKNTDVILNYYSPMVDRPGGGHFTPIGGYNSKTKEILLSEVNLAMNPAFWTYQNTLIEAMLSTNGANEPRGYLVITWTDTFQ